MGLISLFNSTLKLMSDSTNFGISISAVKNISEYFDKSDEEKLANTVKLVRSWSLLAGLLGMFLCIVLSPLLSKFTFSWDGHRLHFIFLSPIVALMALSGGELAILKGLRELKKLAIISILNVLGALISSVPLYYFFAKSNCTVIGNNGTYSVCSYNSLFISYLSLAFNEPLAKYAWRSGNATTWNSICYCRYFRLGSRFFDS